MSPAGAAASAPDGLDAGAVERVHRHLERVAPGLLPGPLRLTLIAGGRSNLTYEVTDGARTVILRRPPLGTVLETAHDMSRECAVLRGLATAGPPVPAVLAECRDPGVLGAPFYVMERIEGQVYRSTAQLAGLDEPAASRLADSVVDALARVHEVDVEAAGLAGLGRPEGYLDRQLSRWWRQYEAVRTRELPGVRRLHEALSAGVPATRRAGLVHGDFQLGNLLVRDARVVGVLDWEMATLGDQLTDVGWLVLSWSDPDSPTAVPGLPGFPSATALVERYGERTGTEPADVHWYTAFSAFKLAVIREGIYRRWLARETRGAGFEAIGDRVAPLVDRARALLAGVRPG